jgi:hypothetical protein
MVTQGWALAFVKYSDAYIAQQAEAEAAKAGIWSGTFAAPWDWRLGKAQAAEQTRDCAIKGNVSAKGERIYHMPFHLYYARTKIDERNGERWFCTEVEAQAAGWRRALR